MTKKILLLFVGIFFMNISVAQELRLGIKSVVPPLNGSLAKAIEDETGNTTYNGFMSRINMGVFINNAFSKHWSLQIEMLYRRQGFEYKSSDAIIDIARWNGSYRFDYVEVPMLVRYKNGRDFEWFVQGGFSSKIILQIYNFGYEWDSEIHRYTEKYVGTYATERVDEHFHPSSITAYGGVGVIYNFSDSFFAVAETNVSYDLTPLSNRTKILNKKWSFDKAKLFNIAYFSIGFGFKL
ncbi:outer membrane beta-barrel protein [Capnocytophaga canis]|uniref:outer membrane beta-barrel protein n=1 Tax=Capnocytophaga canis TaxID=1848903 RepID=UPI0015621946|nr:outer membrane beta-barrel protein [Capnocytophaga canis]